MSDADVAMYEAKGAGGDRLVLLPRAANARRRPARPRPAHAAFRERDTGGDRTAGRDDHAKGRRLIDDAKREANVCALTEPVQPPLLRPADCSARSNAHAREGRAAVAHAARHRPLPRRQRHARLATGDRVLTVDRHGAAVVGACHGLGRTLRGRGIRHRDAGHRRCRSRIARWPSGCARPLPATVIDGVEGQRIAATLSAGVAQLTATTASGVALVQQASKALMQAKTSGRNRVEHAA